MGIPNNRFVIIERQQKVFSMLSHGLTESDISRQLNVDQSTICRDVKRIKRETQRTVEVIAKDILPFEFGKSMQSLNNIIKECWNICQDKSGKWTNKDKLNALKLIKDTERTRLEVLLEGPVGLLVQQLQEKLTEIIENNETAKKSFFVLPALERAKQDMR